MAKWIYEKWSIKWDSSGFSGETSVEVEYAVDIATMTAVAITAAKVGDVALTSSSHADRFNEDLSANLWYVTSINTHISPRHVNASSRLRAKEWLASQRVKDIRLTDVVLEEGTVPDDDIHTDGYLYVKVKPAFPTMRVMRDGAWVEVETGFVLKGGVWKPIEEIYKLQDGQWVQA